MAFAGRAILIVGIAWGAFAFGAVYPWAYWPLVIAGLLVALIGCLAPARPPTPAASLAPIGAACALFLIAVGLQLLPLPLSVLRFLSPAAPDLITQLSVRAGLGISRHSLSIWPPATLVGGVVIGTLMMLVLGASRLMSGSRGAQTVAEAIAMIGVVLAFTGIVQQSVVTNGRIYGFWTPEMPGSAPYGPFVNKNHFGGWMLMALPVVFGLMLGSIARGMRGVRPTTRDRLLWLSSQHASRLLLLSGSALVMALSLFLTLSRSAAGAFAVSIAIACGAILLRQTGTARRIVALSLVVMLAGGAFGWIGPDVILTRFAAPDWGGMSGRTGAWLDALAIARRYPLTGTGLNTYEYSTLFYQTHNLSEHYAQAHNDYLQLAAEGGSLLVFPAALCVWMFVRTVRRRFSDDVSAGAYWLRLGAVTGITAMAVQELVEFSLQMPGNAFLFSVLCAIALHRSEGRFAGRISGAYA